MPTKNRVKTYVPDMYYHIFAGVPKGEFLFKDASDYKAFISFLGRYLGPEQLVDRFGRPYTDLSPAIDLLAFSLAPQHIHLLVYQKELQGITLLMRRLLSSYSIYFNRRYQRQGRLFADRYKAKAVQAASDFWPISRYLHLDERANIQTGEVPRSSYRAYLGKQNLGWLKPQKVLAARPQGAPPYAIYVLDHEDYQRAKSSTESKLAAY